MHFCLAGERPGSPAVALIVANDGGRRQTDEELELGLAEGKLDERRQRNFVSALAS
jgi:hypothetical protein